MRKTALTLFPFLILALSSKATPPVDRAGIDAQIERVISRLDRRGQPDSGKVMVQSLVEAISLAAPETSFSEELEEHIAKAKELFATTSIFNPDGVARLRKSYRLTHSGRDFRMPETILEISDAVEFARKQLTAAREDLRADKVNECVQKLVEIAVMILTPKVH